MSYHCVINHSIFILCTILLVLLVELIQYNDDIRCVIITKTLHQHSMEFHIDVDQILSFGILSRSVSDLDVRHFYEERKLDTLCMCDVITNTSPF